MKTKKILLTLIAAVALLGTTDAVALSQSTAVQASPKNKVKKHKKNIHKKSTKRSSKKRTKKNTKKHVKKTATKQATARSDNSDLRQLTDSDVVGVWVNHINTDIHQQITFHANHTWNENQHGVTNIYHGTWKITGKNRINLQPWDEDIVFAPGNYNQMTVVSFNHTLTKNR